jgi:hypothetical protein
MGSSSLNAEVDAFYFSGAILGAEGGVDLSLKTRPRGHLTTVAKQFEKARKEGGLPNDSSSIARAMALELK